jgi:PPOX class probable F420-dependent enzyme
MAATPAFDHLTGHYYMSLTTFRRSGVPVPTPVWFADLDGAVVIVTALESGKIKRIRHTPRVTVAPCDARGDVLGPQVAGIARFLDGEDAARADAALDAKYGEHKQRILRENPGITLVFLAITPA